MQDSSNFEISPHFFHRIVVDMTRHGVIALSPQMQGINRIWEFPSSFNEWETT